MQAWNGSAGIVALLTFQRFFSGVLPHNVNFQVNGCNAWILAACASVRLFSIVCPRVPFQVVWLFCFVFALIAPVCFLIYFLRDEVVLHEKLHCAHLCGFSSVCISSNSNCRTCCIVGKCTSWPCCGSACGSEARFYLQMSCHTRHKILVWTFSMFTSTTFWHPLITEVYQIERNFHQVMTFPFLGVPAG